MKVSISCAIIMNCVIYTKHRPQLKYCEVTYIENDKIQEMQHYMYIHVAQIYSALSNFGKYIA